MFETDNNIIKKNYIRHSIILEKKTSGAIRATLFLLIISDYMNSNFKLQWPQRIFHVCVCVLACAYAYVARISQIRFYLI
jgi:hypothetical protein